MTTFKQFEANRRNALKSTGPITDAGKQRSRRNAVRHGLTAETVITTLEDEEDYKAFELSVTSGFNSQTAVERELVLRLASLLWRLRRATAIDTGLIQMQSDVLRETGNSQRRLYFQPLQPNPNEDGQCAAGDIPSREKTISEIARSFLRLANLDNRVIERLGRYETALWRQVGQIIFTLDVLRRRNLNEYGTSKRKNWRSRHFR